MLILTLVQTVCKGYQQTTKVAVTRKELNINQDFKDNNNLIKSDPLTTMLLENVQKYKCFARLLISNFTRGQNESRMEIEVFNMVNNKLLEECQLKSNHSLFCQYILGRDNNIYND